jgi:hypothetical protein
MLTFPGHAERPPDAVAMYHPCVDEIAILPAR